MIRTSLFGVKRHCHNKLGLKGASKGVKIRLKDVDQMRPEFSAIWRDCGLREGSRGVFVKQRGSGLLAVF